MAERRPYSSVLRTEQTALTRRRILQAAGNQFAQSGYLGTTLVAIAGAAGVSVQTVYNVVGGKPAVLKAVYDVTLAGDDEPVPMAERPIVRAMMAATDARSCLACYAEMARTLGERTLPLVNMLLAQAATGDSDLRAFADTIESERATGTSNTARHVADQFGLRPGLEPAGAADVLWALTAPDLADRLVNRRNWGWERFQHWLGATMADALIGPH
ncbi:MAG TPA: TetR/AcrR family transcriptional regulator [Kineosporiaceae bacterium]|nr:TetR/AcrR family transcriptional regulator [Kineosporiaceae bacterium]